MYSFLVILSIDLELATSGSGTSGGLNPTTPIGSPSLLGLWSIACFYTLFITHSLFLGSCGSVSVAPGVPMIEAFDWPRVNELPVWQKTGSAGDGSLVHV